MNNPFVEEDVDVMEAIDELSSIAELNIDEINEMSEEDRMSLISSHRWLGSSNLGASAKAIKSTLSTVHEYMKKICNKDGQELQDKKVQKGVQAVMTLANEAAEKIDQYNALFRGSINNKTIRDSKEFKDLEEYYYTKVVSRLQKSLAKEEAWLEEYTDEVQDLKEIRRRGLKDLETVKKDQEYELFYIKKEDGKPFFNRNLLRHIKLVNDFDELFTKQTKQDPFISAPYVQDKDACLAAHYIKEATRPLLDTFMKGIQKYRKEALGKIVFKATLALCLASNAKNELEHSLLKPSLSYFHDFQYYLRVCLSHEDYLYLLQNPPKDKNHFANQVIRLIHAFCYYLFVRDAEHVRSLNFIDDLNVLQSQSKNLWMKLIEMHESMQEYLINFPNGPLMKSFDVLQLEEQPNYDPLLLENYPACIYTLHGNHIEAKAIRLASPTMQSQINKANVVYEFKGFLRFLLSQKKHMKHLLFNFQDRTSWKGFARSNCLEKMQYDAEISDVLTVVSLPKHTDFYYQRGEYRSIDDAKEFLQLFINQLSDSKGSGFFFPSQISQKELKKFIKNLCDLVYQHLFDKAKKLPRNKRLDFIELVYYFLQLKIIDLVQPTSFSFTCKDWIDIGSTSSAGFYGFCQIYSGRKDYLELLEDPIKRLCFAPALLLRERVVDAQKFNRMISALSLFDNKWSKNKDKIQKDFDKLLKATKSKYLNIEL